MLRVLSRAAAACVLLGAPTAWATQPLPPPPPPPPGYHAPVPAEGTSGPDKPPPAPRPAAPAHRHAARSRGAASPPRKERKPRDGEVAVHIHSDQPAARYELFDPDFPKPVAGCTGSCTVYVLPGRYRLTVSPTHSTRAGTSSVRVEHGTRLEVSPRGYASRWAGLGTAVGGMGTMVAGVTLLATGSKASGSRFAVGLASFLMGAAATPIGWVIFGKSYRPSVRVLPPHHGEGDAASARFGIGPGGLSFSARF